MKYVKVVIASTKQLIAKSIQKMLMADSDVIIQAMVYDKEDLTVQLHNPTFDVLIIDQQMLSELYVWKNMHPKTLKRSMKVLLITSEKFKKITGELPGFVPNQVSFWEQGMDDLQRFFDLLKKNEQAIFKGNNRIYTEYVNKFDLN